MAAKGFGGPAMMKMFQRLERQKRQGLKQSLGKEDSKRKSEVGWKPAATAVELGCRDKSRTGGARCGGGQSSK